MRIRFDAARSETLSWKESIEVSPEELQGLDLLAVGPIDCRGTVSFVDPDFVLHGGLAWEQTVACNRCLKPIQVGATAELDLVLVEKSRPRAAVEVELSESDLGVVEVQGDSFETRPMVLEQVELNVPMKPLCREDCQGLCPVCGADRNETDCACAAARQAIRGGRLSRL